MEITKQQAGENSTQINNVNGDVRIGVTFDEVEKICLLLFENNFPKLMEKSQRESLENIREMLLILKEKIELNKEHIDNLKISKPDVQYSLNESIKEVGRKGSRVDFDLLTNALVEKLKENKDDFEIVLDQTLAIIPKLTEEYIKFLSSTYFILWLNFDDIKTAEQIEESFIEFNKKIGFNLEISEEKKIFLSGLGLGNYIGFGFSRRLNKQNLFLQRYNVDLEKDKNQMKYTNQICDIAEEQKLANFLLTPIGNLVAILYMKKFFISLNPKVVI